MSEHRSAAGPTELAYEVLGGGPHTLVFHWGMFGDREQFRPLAEAVADVARCVLVDGRGYGASEPYAVPHSLEDYTEDLAAFLHGVVGGPAVLVGQSMGAMTYLRLALAHPELVTALALMDTSAEPEDPALKPGYEALLDAAAEQGVTTELLDMVALVLMSEHFRTSRPDLLADWRDRHLALAERFEAFRHHTRAVLDRTDVSGRLGEITAPALVLVGDQDVSTPPARAEVIVKGLGGPAELVTIPDAGHFAPWERPEVTAAALRDFLATLP